MPKQVGQSNSGRQLINPQVSMEGTVVPNQFSLSTSSKRATNHGKRAHFENFKRRFALFHSISRATTDQKLGSPAYVLQPPYTSSERPTGKAACFAILQTAR